ncbi:MAG: iron-containing alcohol dehydrogenase, partial [Candidatus Pararuminococcus gallinarum]
KVQEGARLARENHVDMLLAVGGGSVMDCSKAVSLAAKYNGDAWEDFWAHQGVIEFEPLPLGVVVTVAGTGSECNGGAVITNEEKKIKTGRDYPQLNPRFALMDPTYTFSVPKGQMISGGFDILSHIMETYFSDPNEDNVSDEIMEALMKNVICNLRAAIQNPEDYTARSNLMWDSTMAENRVIKMGKRCDFQCHNMEHQIGAYTNCNHGYGLAVLHPVYYRHIYKEGLPKFVRFARNVWGITCEGKTDETLALAGIDALEDFIKEIGLPTTLKELGADASQLKEIADSCAISQGSYKIMTHEEILEIFQECYE